MALVGLSLAACGTQPGDRPNAAGATARTAALASPPPAAKAPAVTAKPTSAPLPPTVDLKQPVIDFVPPAAATDPLAAALATEGVNAVAVLRSFSGQIVAPDADGDVTIAAVDPLAFRPFTPEPTAQAPEVWERLLAGDILVRHDVAHDLGLELGGIVLLLTPAGQVEVRVGAFASNGAPPVADVIVPWSVGTVLGNQEHTSLLVALEEGASNSKVRRSLVAALGGGKATARALPAAQQASLTGAGSHAKLAPFTYTDLGDGMISIKGRWVRDWIVGIDLPVVGRAFVNRIMVDQLVAAFAELDRLDLLDLIDAKQFGGGWVPRHIDWNPRKPLSMHAWGLAIDINTADNALGAKPTLDPRIVATFERWGFAWGGRWSRPDGMHFELAKVIRTH